MINTGRRKVVFSIAVFCILMIVAVIGYFLTLQKIPILKTPAISLSIIPSPKFSYRQDIVVDEQSFNPAIAKIKIGTLVKWINQSGQDVAIVSDPQTTHDAYPGLNLGRFPNGSGVSLIFNKAGTYGYYNYLHTEQTGTIVVE